MNSRKELLTRLWALYTKQKNLEREAGRDVEPELARMKGWFRAALNGACTSETRTEIFGEEAHITTNPLCCDVCGDTGWRFREDAVFERSGPHGRLMLKAPGMTVCYCAAGTKRNEAIRDIGRRKETGRERRGNFY